MRTPLNTEYRNLTVYFNIHASMPLQFKAYSPKFIIKFLAPMILPYPKMRDWETNGAIHSSISQPSLESLIIDPN